MIQDKIVEMRQNARSSLFFLGKELRSAGFDPADSNNFGFVTDFDDNDPIFGGTPIDYIKEKDRVAFTIDGEGDANGTVEATDNEQIAYRFNRDENTLERYVFAGNPLDPANPWQAIAANVEAFDLVYLDRNGNVTTNPGNFHAVQISLLIKSARIEHKYKLDKVFLNKQGEDICPVTCTVGSHYRRQMLSTTVRLRNM